MEITTQAAFQKAVKEGSILVDFYTTWCGPCKHQAKILHDAEKDILNAFPEIKIVSIDIECAPYFGALADELKIHSIPQLVLFTSNGNGGLNAYKMEPGTKSYQNIKTFLKEYLN